MFLVLSLAVKLLFAFDFILFMCVYMCLLTYDTLLLGAGLFKTSLNFLRK